MSITNFRNILLSAIDCKEFVWAENFINEFSAELHSDYIVNMRHYSFAKLEYAKKNYEAALENLIKVKYEYFLFKIDVKELMFKIYIEMGLFENALSVLNTMKQYVENTKDLSEAFRLRYKNFVKFSGEFLNVKLNGSKKDIGFLKKNIEIEDNVSSRQWLLDKIDADLKTAGR